MTSNWIQTNASSVADVAAGPDGRVWVAETTGTVWYSDDQGKTFHHVAASGFARLAVGPDSNVWGVGANGTLWVLNTALSWNKVATTIHAIDVTVAPDDTVWLVAADGTVFSSTNRGGTFTQIPAAGFSRVAADTDNSLWAVGSNGTLWHYSAAGVGGGWTQTPASGMQDVGVEWLNYFGGVHSGRVWLAGSNGTVWLTIDQGATFTQKADASGFASVAGAGATSKVPPGSDLVEDVWAVGANGTLWYHKIVADYIATTGTTHFQIQVDSALGGAGLAVAEQLTWVIEGVYQKLSSFFGGIQAKVTPILLSVDAINDGARSSISSIDIHAMADINMARWMFVAELAEVFMRSQGSPWNPNNSKGEGLSCLLAEEAFPGLSEGRVNAWLNSGRDPHWITVNDGTDANPVSYGCALLYLNYLHYQLHYPLDKIIGDQSDTLAGIYSKISGKPDAVSDFVRLINAHFPPGKPVNLARDKVFPLA